MKVVVLGVSGMLGSMVLDYLATDSSLELTATVRNPDIIGTVQNRIPGIRWSFLDAEHCDTEGIAAILKSTSFVINAIGVIKPYVHDDNAVEVKRAITVNAFFPHLLATAAEQTGSHVMQIATDCVYSGSRGAYNEKDSHDCLDVYGKTKSLGEVFSQNVHHLRCSIIGPEPKGHVSLLDWFVRQPPKSTVNGYTNHHWNGVTTLQFARLCHGIMTRNIDLPHIQHVIPAGTISKADLLGCFARDFRRQDITIIPGEAKTVIDRTLATSNENLNRQLWAAAGYSRVPSVPEMVTELAAFKYRFAAEGGR